MDRIGLHGRKVPRPSVKIDEVEVGMDARMADVHAGGARHDDPPWCLW